MSLQNHVGRSLETVAPDPAAIRQLLAAAGRNLADARLTGKGFRQPAVIGENSEAASGFSAQPDRQ
jgi:hypothetical protein